MWYWMNMETGKVMASGEPPYGADWIELSKEEYEMALHPMTPANTGLHTDAAKAEPYFDDSLPEEHAVHLKYLKDRRAGKA